MANELARRLRQRMTRQEVRLWLRLRALRPLGLHFRRQDPREPFIVDFLCRRYRLAIELDGSQHAEAGHAACDRGRDARLTAEGYHVLRFWNCDVDQSIEAVVEAILEAARSNPTRPLRGHPPLVGEGRASSHAAIPPLSGESVAGGDGWGGQP